MTQNLWQKRLRLSFSKDVIDIVQYGSSLITGVNPNDIDIAVIFCNVSLKEQLEESQRIKKQIQALTEPPVHIKSFDLYSLTDKSNFARENIIFGKSILTADDFSRRFGFKPVLQVLYSLKDLRKKDKIRFNYALNGKHGRYGLLKAWGGKIVRPGLVEINLIHEKVFLDTIKKITSDYKTRKVLVSCNKEEK